MAGPRNLKEAKKMLIMNARLTQWVEYYEDQWESWTPAQKERFLKALEWFQERLMKLIPKGA